MACYLKSARVNDLFNQCIVQPVLEEKALLQEEVNLFLS